MPQNDNQVIEPNFEGEEMKMPSSYVAPEVIGADQNPSLVNWPIIILLGLILAAILGGLYYWYYTIMSTPLHEPSLNIRPTAEENNEPESTTAEARTETMGAVSTSDELDAIEADLDSTNLDELDAELNAIDAELENAMSDQ